MRPPWTAPALGGALAGAALLLSTGCAAAGLPATPGAVRDARMREGGTVEGMLDDLATVPMVFFGEQHAHPDHQALERRILEGLVARRRGVMLGMEMFERPFQPVLDRWSAGELSEEEFVREGSWYEGWGYDWSLYRGILLAARDLRVPVIALNADRAVVRQVGQRGIEGLDPWMRARIPDEIPVGEGPHRSALFEVYRAHVPPGKPVDRAAFQRFYEAQVTWDETMAESAVLALGRAGAGGSILVLAGSMHVDGFHAIPERARRRNGLPYRTVIAIPLPDAAGEDAAPERLPEGPGRRADWYVRTAPHPGLGPWTGIRFSGREPVVRDVAADSPAAAAGLRAGDVLLSVDGRPARDTVAFRLALEGRRAGDAVALEWRRDGGVLAGTLVLAPPPPPTFR